MSYRSSRPSSAASRRSSVGDRHVSHGEKEAFLMECKAAYLTIFDDLSTEIRSKQELYKVLQQAGRNPVSRTINKYWTSRTEYLTFEDFCDICKKEPATSEDELKKAFQKIDVNGDGFITISELRRILSTRGERMTKEEVQELIDEVDENGDGKLNYKEFIKMVIKTQEECKKLAMKNLERRQNKSSRGQQSPRMTRETAVTSENDLTTSGESDAVITEYGPQSETETKLLSKPNPRQRRRSTLSLTSAQNITASKTSLQSVALIKDHDSSSNYSNNAQENFSVNISNSESGKKDRPPLKPSNNISEAKPIDSDDDDGIIYGSTSKSSLSSKPSSGFRTTSPPTPTPRSSRSNRDHSEESGSSSGKSKDRHEWSRPGLTSKQLTLQHPKSLKDWKLVKSKGCFFRDNMKIIGHQYGLRVAQDTKAWVTIEPVTITSGDLNNICEKNGCPMDVMVFLLDENGRLVAATEQHDNKGKSGVICDLEKGSYHLIAFTSGCRLKKRNSVRQLKEVDLIRRKDGKVTLTKDYKSALNTVFDMFDLNSDGLLSREEFNLYSLRTNGQDVADPEWEAVEANIDLRDGQITREGFLQLNQMEAEENQDNPEELWETLESLGFNRSLIMDEVSPFYIEIYTERSNTSLKATRLDSTGKTFTNILKQQAVEKGETLKVRGAKDILLHSLITQSRACLILENKSSSKVNIFVDCSHSQNVVSHQGGLTCSVEIPPKASMVAHHLLPVKNSQSWTVVCQESILK